MIKVLSVFGTRPEAIKMAPLIKELEKYPELFENRVCVTAHHREMLDQVLNLFAITPDHDLDIMKPGQDLFGITSTVLQGLKDLLEKEKPDIVLVHGDTTTTMAATIASFYSRTKILEEAALLLKNRDVYREQTMDYLIEIALVSYALNIRIMETFMFGLPRLLRNFGIEPIFVWISGRFAGGILSV